jgi:hypothetical protein
VETGSSTSSADNAEAEHRQSDFLDREVVISELVGGRVIEETGPVEAEIHQLLHA